MDEFTINASVSETTGYAPFKLNSSHMPSMIKELHSDEVVYKGIKEFLWTALMYLANVHDSIIEAHIFQMSHANNCQSNEPAIDKGSLDYL
ncbi:hypothetical protein J132_03699 [Termitomyces sp. J132]|nr:hypothetical protein J132_03699 [Termitomyces sp. J132]